jgi:hypothetical protein
MCFKHARTDRNKAARKRLSERPVEQPRHQASRPRGNAAIDERDLQRSREKLETLVGR